MPRFLHGPIEIDYLDEGDGDPIVLVHGIASTKEVNWVLPGWVSALVKAGRRAIALDGDMVIRSVIQIINETLLETVRRRAKLWPPLVFTLANYRLGPKCTSLRGWLPFHGAIPSSARSPESSRICGATLHLENEPAPSARQQASCLP
jgi:hypothetical protein